MIKYFLALVLSLVTSTKDATADIYLISEGIRSIEVSVVYCNHFQKDAILTDLTGGHFEERQPAIVPAGSCKAFRLVTGQKRILIHAVADYQIDVLQYERNSEPWFSETVWLGLVFTLFGLLLATLQELFKTLLSQPAAIISLVTTYHSEKERFKQFVDDGAKRFILSETLIDLAAGKASPVVWLPRWLLKRIVHLVALRTTWQNENPISTELRTSILKL